MFLQSFTLKLFVFLHLSHVSFRQHTHIKKHQRKLDFFSPKDLNYKGLGRAERIEWKERSKQELMNKDNSAMIVRERRQRRVWGKWWWTESWLGVVHTPYSVQMMRCRVMHLKPVEFCEPLSPPKFSKKKKI